jgi:FkbH-like protein
MSSVRKCIVWDLDNTLWDGVCLEGSVRVRTDVVVAIAELDRRGILHSIASRGDEDVALKALKENNLDGLFLAPRINWLPKSQNIVRIVNELRIALDSVAFVDDERFEREQVTFMLPDVLTIASENANEITGWPEFCPETVTREARERRGFYRSELYRKQAEHQFASREEFLRSCEMKLRIRPMEESDIPRVLELMTRTHQLNTTGLMLDQSLLTQIFCGEQGSTRLIVADLRDRFGGYGIIGTAMVETDPLRWRLTYLAVSCRVMGRGVERALLASMVREGMRDGFQIFEASYHDTGRNRMMRALYQMMGFRQTTADNEKKVMIFRAVPADVPDVPRWVEVD